MTQPVLRPMKAIYHYVNMIVKHTDEFADEFEFSFFNAARVLQLTVSQSPMRMVTLMCRFMTLLRACLFPLNRMALQARKTWLCFLFV